jgi:hypothetical protein
MKEQFKSILFNFENKLDKITPMIRTNIIKKIQEIQKVSPSLTRLIKNYDSLYSDASFNNREISRWFLTQ